METLTTVCCNGITTGDSAPIEALKLELNQQRQQSELAVMRLAIVHLQHGDVSSACVEFEALKNKDLLAVEMVRAAYSSKKVHLQHLATFACGLRSFSTGYNAIYELYQDLATNNRQEDNKEVVIMTLYFRLRFMVNFIGFSNETDTLKIDILQLKTTLAKHLQITEIASSSFAPSVTYEIISPKCEAVDTTPPAPVIHQVVHNMIYGDTSSCRLINRYYNEPLYCTTHNHKEHGYRRIYLWTPRDNDHDQYWNIIVVNP